VRLGFDIFFSVKNVRNVIFFFLGFAFLTMYACESFFDELGSLIPETGDDGIDTVKRDEE
jgi:hypothetical protein